MILTLRIFWPQIADAARQARLFAFVERHRALCQELSFFTEGDGNDWRWLPPAEIVHRAERMAAVVAEARARGFATAVNVLNTMGHSDEGGAAAPLPGWRRMVGHDGAESRMTPCPCDPDFLAYVDGKYRAFAASGADRCWIDDDVRLRNHSPVARGCFCAVCLDLLGRRLGRVLGRAQLAEAVERDPAGRRAWAAHEQEVLGAVIATAVAAVRAAGPATEVGLMVCDGHDHRAAVACMGAGGHRPWLRPGGGFWNDDEPRGMLRKVLAVQAQCAGLPAATGIALEIENYPFATGGKSAAMTGLEGLLAILGGRLDGIMFDVLDGFGNDPAGHHGWLTRLGAWAPCLHAAAAAVAGTQVRGWQVLGHQAQALQLAGLPVVGGADGALGAILSGAAAAEMDAADLARLLDRPLIMDGAAAERCVALGLGERIGVRALTAHGEGVHEVATAHPLNGDDRGQRRAFTLRYFGLTSHALELHPGTQALSWLRTTGGGDAGAAASLSSPPGRAAVAVLGHAPWTHVLSPARIRQLSRLSAAMLGAALPLAVEADGPLAWWFRAGGGRRIAALANPGFDPLAVEVAADGPPQLSSALPGAALDEAGPGRWRCTLPPWSAAVLTWPAA